MALKSVRFVPKIKSFELTFAKGETGTLRVAELTEKAAAVEVKFETGARGPSIRRAALHVRARKTTPTAHTSPGAHLGPRAGPRGP